MENVKKSESYDKKIYRLGVGLSLKFIIVALITLFILLLSFFIEGYDFETIGQLGDATGGFISPIIALSAALLTFLAFYVQYQANKQVEKQFIKQQNDDAINFEYNKLKERIYLINKEVDNFDIAFHEGKLISKLNEIPKSSGRKYNFSGVQGLNLFLIEYFRDKKEKEANETKKFKFDDSFHSIALNVTNLIVFFVSTHNVIIKSSLLEDYKLELQELLAYVYYSKISFLVEQFNINDPSGNLSDRITELKKFYSAKNKNV